jgi:uncharacterized protein (DUF433 family)
MEVYNQGMQSEYVEQRNGGYYVKGTRVSLDSVVYAFQHGDSPERILEQYPALDSLARIYGAIAFYLDHQAQIDQYLIDEEREFEASGVPLEQVNPGLWNRIQEYRAKKVRETAARASGFKEIQTSTSTSSRAFAGLTLPSTSHRRMSQDYAGFPIQRFSNERHALGGFWFRMTGARCRTTFEHTWRRGRVVPACC